MNPRKIARRLFLFRGKVTWAGEDQTRTARLARRSQPVGIHYYWERQRRLRSLDETGLTFILLLILRGEMIWRRSGR